MAEDRSITIPILIGVVSLLLNLILPAVILCNAEAAVGKFSNYGCRYIEILLRILGL